MKTTRDKAGGVVIRGRPRLVRVGRRLVARPSAPADTLPAIDIAALIEQERHRLFKYEAER